MRNHDSELEHLLKSAARARRPLPEQVPFALEARVLAQWRRGSAAAGEAAQFFLPLLRRAALCACLLMLLSIAFSYRALLSGDNDEVALANSAIDLSVLP